MKRFDGWEPVEVAEHEYDGDRLIRTVTCREPEWDEEERAWMLAWLTYDANVHEACGHYLPDSTALEGDEGYEVPEAIRCHACTARVQAFARYSESPAPEALLFPARRRERR